MPFYHANRGLYTLMATALGGSTDVRVAAYKGTAPTQAVVQDWNFLTDVVGTEAAASGYARVDLPGISLVEDDTANNVKFQSTAPATFGPVATGETWPFLVYFVQVGADSANPIIGVDVLATPYVTAGPGVLVQFPTFVDTATG